MPVTDDSAAGSVHGDPVLDATVMMVDDEPLNMQVLQLHLESAGYARFVTVERSVEALATLRAERPDVLLLDLMMPEVSGFDILEALRADAEYGDLPVIVLTSSTDAPTKLRALELGATDFLSKPVDQSELALRVRNTLAARAWQRRARHVDPLTELPNRDYLTRLLRRRLDAGVGGADRRAALVLFDLDRFAQINSSLGTAAGDAVLVGFAERLIGAFGRRAPAASDAAMADLPMVPGRADCVARLGADRFALLMPVARADHARELIAALDRFLATLREPFAVDAHSMFVDASVGIAMLETGATPEQLLSDAGTALVGARARSDAVYAFYSADMDTAARARLGMENGLRTAIEAGEIHLEYQPKVDVASGEVRGAEALVRWTHPEFGLVSPVDFVPLAEHVGMIVPIGEWVLREGCRQAAAWRAAGHAGFRIAINVSIRQLHEPDFPNVVERALADTGLDPTALVIELTENMIMDDAEASLDKLARLKALGLSLSIDDFGTGYSSLGYLQRFPIDQLKIDRSFVMEIRSALEPAPIVKAVVSLAHDLGLTVVAEGVETHHQLARLKALGCEEYQGYLFSRPVPADAFEALLDGEGGRLSA